MKSIILRYLTLVALLCSVAWLASAPGWPPILAGIPLLAAYLRLDNRFSALPNLKGRWEYSVTTADEGFSHRGDCNIHQDGQDVRIEGVRRYTCALQSRRKVCRAVNIPWASHWAQICDDHFLRFEYHIALAQPGRGGNYIQAVCRLKLPSASVPEMNGNYYMLPPFDEATLNCQWGVIVLRKLAPGEKPRAPTGYKSESEVPEEQSASA